MPRTPGSGYNRPVARKKRRKEEAVSSARRHPTFASLPLRQKTASPPVSTERPSLSIPRLPQTVEPPRSAQLPTLGPPPDTVAAFMARWPGVRPTGLLDRRLANAQVAHYDVHGDWMPDSLAVDIMNGAQKEFDTYESALNMMRAGTPQPTPVLPKADLYQGKAERKVPLWSRGIGWIGSGVSEALGLVAKVGETFPSLGPVFPGFGGLAGEQIKTDVDTIFRGITSNVASDPARLQKPSLQPFSTIMRMSGDRRKMAEVLYASRGIPGAPGAKGPVDQFPIKTAQWVTAANWADAALLDNRNALKEMAAASAAASGAPGTFNFSKWNGRGNPVKEAFQNYENADPEGAHQLLYQATFFTRPDTILAEDFPLWYASTYGTDKLPFKLQAPTIKEAALRGQGLSGLFGFLNVAPEMVFPNLAALNNLSQADFANSYALGRAFSRIVGTGKGAFVKAQEWSMVPLQQGSRGLGTAYRQLGPITGPLNQKFFLWGLLSTEGYKKMNGGQDMASALHSMVSLSDYKKTWRDNPQLVPEFLSGMGLDKVQYRVWGQTAELGTYVLVGALFDRAMLGGLRVATGTKTYAAAASALGAQTPAEIMVALAGDRGVHGASQIFSVPEKVAVKIADDVHDTGTAGTMYRDGMGVYLDPGIRIDVPSFALTHKFKRFMDDSIPERERSLWLDIDPDPYDITSSHNVLGAGARVYADGIHSGLTQAEAAEFSGRVIRAQARAVDEAVATDQAPKWEYHVAPEIDAFRARIEESLKERPASKGFVEEFPAIEEPTAWNEWNYYRRLCQEARKTEIGPDGRMYSPKLVTEVDPETGQMVTKVVEAMKTEIPKRLAKVKKELDDNNAAHKNLVDERRQLQVPQLPGAELFRAVPAESLRGFRSQSKRPHMLSPEDYVLGDPNSTFYQSRPGSGYVLTRDADTGKLDLRAVHNNTGRPGLGKEAVASAIENGAETLDCFDGYLSQILYKKAGFEEYRREPWNPEYRPEDWPDEAGTPDVVYMRYTARSRNVNDVRARLGLGGAEETAAGRVAGEEHGAGHPGAGGQARGAVGAGQRPATTVGPSGTGEVLAQPELPMGQMPADAAHRLAQIDIELAMLESKRAQLLTRKERHEFVESQGAGTPETESQLMKSYSLGINIRDLAHFNRGPAAAKAHLKQIRYADPLTTEWKRINLFKLGTIIKMMTADEGLMRPLMSGYLPYPLGRYWSRSAQARKIALESPAVARLLGGALDQITAPRGAGEWGYLTTENPHFFDGTRPKDSAAKVRRMGKKWKDWATIEMQTRGANERNASTQDWLSAFSGRLRELAEQRGVSIMDEAVRKEAADFATTELERLGREDPKYVGSHAPEAPKFSKWYAEEKVKNPKLSKEEAYDAYHKVYPFQPGFLNQNNVVPPPGMLRDLIGDRVTEWARTRGERLTRYVTAPDVPPQLREQVINIMMDHLTNSDTISPEHFQGELGRWVRRTYGEIPVPIEKGRIGGRTLGMGGSSPVHNLYGAATLPFHATSDLMFSFLEGMDKRVKRNAFAANFDAETARINGDPRWKGLPDTVREEAAANHALSRTVSQSYLNKRTLFDDTIRNLSLYFPAYRQSYGFYLPLAAKHPMTTAAVINLINQADEKTVRLGELGVPLGTLTYFTQMISPESMAPPMGAPFAIGQEILSALSPTLTGVVGTGAMKTYQTVSGFTPGSALNRQLDSILYAASDGRWNVGNVYSSSGQPVLALPGAQKIKDARDKAVLYDYYRQLLLSGLDTSKASLPAAKGHVRATETWKAILGELTPASISRLAPVIEFNVDGIHQKLDLAKLAKAQSAYLQAEAAGDPGMMAQAIKDYPPYATIAQAYSLHGDEQLAYLAQPGNEWATLFVSRRHQVASNYGMLQMAQGKITPLASLEEMIQNVNDKLAQVESYKLRMAYQGEPHRKLEAGSFVPASGLAAVQAAFDKAVKTGNWKGTGFDPSLTAKVALKMAVPSRGGKIAINDQVSWAYNFLQAGGFPVTPDSIAFLVAWQNREGQWGASGRFHASAQHNPLNTTLGPGDNADLNAIGVKSYSTWERGIQMSLDTLRNGRYDSIIAALRSGQPTAHGDEMSGAMRTWSGQGYETLSVPSVAGLQQLIDSASAAKTKTITQTVKMLSDQAATTARTWILPAMVAAYDARFKKEHEADFARVGIDPNAGNWQSVLRAKATTNFDVAYPTLKMLDDGSPSNMELLRKSEFYPQYTERRTADQIKATGEVVSAAIRSPATKLNIKPETLRLMGYAVPAITDPGYAAFASNVTKASALVGQYRKMLTGAKVSAEDRARFRVQFDQQMNGLPLPKAVKKFISASPAQMLMETNLAKPNLPEFWSGRGHSAPYERLKTIFENPKLSRKQTIAALEKERKAASPQVKRYFSEYMRSLAWQNILSNIDVVRKAMINRKVDGQPAPITVGSKNGKAVVKQVDAIIASLRDLMMAYSGQDLLGADIERYFAKKSVAASLLQWGY